MKSTILLCCALIASHLYFGQAQIYFSEDFSGGLGQFTSTDVDGDGEEWGTVDRGDGQGNVATSASWTSATGPLTPDNWLISSAIDLTAATGTLYLEWKVRAQDQSWADEYYSVYVGTTGTVAALTASATNFSETVGTSSGYMNRSLDVSAFAGQTIYIGVRHHNVTDMFYLNVDDFTIREVFPLDIAMSAITMESTSAATIGSQLTIEGTVTNVGYNTITSFDLVWDDGSGANTETISATIAPYDSYNFTHGTNFSPASAVKYDLNIYTDLASDGDRFNDSLSKTAYGLIFEPSKYVVIEEGTGTWCGFCPRGAVAMEALSNDPSRPNFIGIAVHNSDPMAVAAYDAGANFGGYPSMNVNRKLLDEGVSTTTMQDLYDQEVVLPTLADVAVSGSYDGAGAISVDVSATFATQLTTECRLAAVLVENNVTGTTSGYAQVNYYNGGTYGPLSGAGISDWTTAGDPVPASQMVYDHVGRVLYGGYNGASGSVSVPTTASTTQSTNFTGTVGSFDPTNLSVVGMLINSETGEIINSNKSALVDASTSVDENEVVQLFTLYPNPANEYVVANFTLLDNVVPFITIVNSLGQQVKNVPVSGTAGMNSVRINTSDFPAGIYFFNVISNNGTATKRFVVE